jgi:hypothetical protein
MLTKLFITCDHSKDTFASLSAAEKYSKIYFSENGWTIKYFVNDWDYNIEKYNIILLWSLQQSNEQRHYKKEYLLKLLEMQHKNKYIILDYIEDIHHIDNFYKLNYEFYSKYFSTTSKNYIIGRYHTPLLEKFPDCNIYTIPYSINHTLIPQFNKTPINKILLSGYIHHTVYPLRYKIFNLMDTYPIDILQHPGYRNLTHKIVNTMYYNKLNEYIASVATCASVDYNYIVAKYFEIPASGALLFAYIDPIIDDLTTYGFKDMVNMVAFNNDNLEYKIEYILDPNNREEIDKIRLNGYNLILEKHTHHTRFNIEFDAFIENLIEHNIPIIG